jgi:hypothetical protein
MKLPEAELYHPPMHRDEEVLETGSQLVLGWTPQAPTSIQTVDSNGRSTSAVVHPKACDLGLCLLDFHWSFPRRITGPQGRKVVQLAYSST